LERELVVDMPTQTRPEQIVVRMRHPDSLAIAHVSLHPESAAHPSIVGDTIRFIPQVDARKLRMRILFQQGTNPGSNS
jgi:hypothetical protein